MGELKRKNSIKYALALIFVLAKDNKNKIICIWSRLYKSHTKGKKDFYHYQPKIQI